MPSMPELCAAGEEKCVWEMTPSEGAGNQKKGKGCFGLLLWVGGIRQNISCLHRWAGGVGVACSFPCARCLLLAKTIITPDSLAAQTSPWDEAPLGQAGLSGVTGSEMLPAFISCLCSASASCVLMHPPGLYQGHLICPQFVLSFLCKGMLSTAEMPAFSYSLLFPLNQAQRLPVKPCRLYTASP